MITQHQHGQPEAEPYKKRIVSLQIVSILWMCLEAAVAVFAAVRARSVALLGFGLDSGIELTSASVVLLRFKKGSHLNEKNAARLTGFLLFALAAFIVASSILALTNAGFKPEPSYLGIGLLIAAALAMPWFASQKRTLSRSANSSSLKADAVQSSMCAYLAWIALGGLLLNAVFKLSWADPVAALFLVPIIVREGYEAVRGKTCSDCVGYVELLDL